MSLLSFLKRQTEPPKESPVGSYHVAVVSLPEELEWQHQLPVELQYLFSVAPEMKERIHTILSSGKAIGIRTITRTPEHILHAIRVISENAQHNCVITWLAPLLRDNHLPVFTNADYEKAKKQGEDLDKALHTLRAARLSFKTFVLIDEENVGISDVDRRLMTELSERLYPLAIETIVNRTIIDNANERTEIAQTIIKSMLFIGPIAHILEKFVAGFGKVFAASTDDLLAEAAELSALRGSGFTWLELSKRFYVLVPVFAIATYGAFQVEHLIEEGRVLLGGAVFGLSAVALSLTTAIQSIGMYKTSIRKLRAEGKMHTHGRKRSDFVEAIIQDFTNPARLGLLLGASMAPIMGMIAASAGLMSNGWILAAVGSTESIVAGMTVIFSSKINNLRFARTLRQRIPSGK